MSLWPLSLVLVVADLASMLMLTAMVLHLRTRLRLAIWIRFFAMCLAISLGLHAAEQVDLLFDYRPPRAFTWIAVFLSMHALIGACFWRTFIRHP